jgi:hypothetical protein
VTGDSEADITQAALVPPLLLPFLLLPQDPAAAIPAAYEA